MRTIDDEWNDFRETTMHPEASEGQTHDMHMAFLAGAASLKTLLETHPDNDCMRILTNLENQVAAAAAANKIRSLAQK